MKYKLTMKNSFRSTDKESLKKTVTEKICKLMERQLKKAD